ncbi:transmembrane sensor [Catalinimonas alkaloidigena]|uniref:FecR family protein n=1 Tax=Catalinimonas alkaloidigena TaxID=1075417 RepID=UPI002405702C|nr:FecR domain-containing protein [Catalinimonas alkaloidigena]MDF9796629.1 transmembrane sensor [Catalinimonas alkaloidigena]
MDYYHYDVDDFAADPLFIRWVKQADEDTNLFWENWLAKYPEKADTIAQAKSIVAFLSFHAASPTEEEQKEVKKKVMQKVKSSKHEDMNKGYLGIYLSVAATMTFLLLAGYLMWRFAFYTPYQEYITDFGEQYEVLLPDRTVVQLNANSSLRISNEWTENQLREVWLEGEAFFDVVKMPDAADGRFIVHTEQLDVEVLGTTFNVQARHGETQVVLNTGKVKLNQLSQADNVEAMFLEPGEMATLGKQKKLVKRQVNPKVYSSWKENRLIFENEDIRNIAQRLQDIYGYEVKVTNEEWLDLKFTGSCPTDDISILLLALTESFDFEAKLNNQQIIIQQHEQP